MIQTQPESNENKDDTRGGSLRLDINSERWLAIRTIIKGVSDDLQLKETMEWYLENLNLNDFKKLITNHFGTKRGFMIPGIRK